MRVRSVLYRAARDLGTIEAAARGPVPLGKRLVRRPIYRTVNRTTARALRRLRLQ